MNRSQQPMVKTASWRFRAAPDSAGDATTNVTVRESARVHDTAAVLRDLLSPSAATIAGVG